MWKWRMHPSRTSAGSSGPPLPPPSCSAMAGAYPTFSALGHILFIFRPGPRKPSGGPSSPRAPEHPDSSGKSTQRRSPQGAPQTGRASARESPRVAKGALLGGMSRAKPPAQRRTARSASRALTNVSGETLGAVRPRAPGKIASAGRLARGAQNLHAGSALQGALGRMSRATRPEQAGERCSHAKSQRNVSGEAHGVALRGASDNALADGRLGRDARSRDPERCSRNNL